MSLVKRNCRRSRASPTISTMKLGSRSGTERRAWKSKPSKPAISPSVAMSSNSKPITQQRDLAKLPRALAPLLERPQWAVWRWTQKPDGTWQKPPLMATQPDRHASTSDPSTWSSYETALAAVRARQADGISYILTEDDPFAAIVLDHCRDLETRSIDIWAQLFLERGRNTYTEVTPSGTGCRIWGLANGGPLHKKFTLKAGPREFEPEKIIFAELFRCTRKALTITGYRLNTVRELTNIDRVFDWAVIWGERRKAEAAAAEEAVRATNGGNGFNSDGCVYSIDQIEHFVREGAPPEANRSELFHTIIGHYLGCGWDQEKIFEHLQQFPDGIGGRYLSENRLRGEISRSAGKYGAVELPWSGESGWTDGGGQQAKAAPAPQPEPVQPPPPPPPLPPAPDPELENNELDDPELVDELEDDEKDEPEQSDLPQLFVHGSPDPRPLTTWLVKHILPARGHGLLSGQWGTAKTFTAIDLAAEGANQVRLRFDAVWKEKCGDGKERAPFCWYEVAPTLLQKGSAEKLIAMARQAEPVLMEQYGLPLGLIIIDTLAACAGYRRSGDENDNAVGQALMNVLRTVAQEIDCFVLGVDHFGKDMEAGTRGAAAKESSADSVLVCLGHKELSGAISNARLAVRKNRGGPQGQEYPFTLRRVEMGQDEDGEPETTMVVDWLPPGATAAPSAPDDPWAKPKRQDQRTAALRLKRVLMAPDGPVVRMVDEKLVRKAFYACTPADGTPEQKGRFRRQRFLAALDWAEQQQLIGAGEVNEVSYLWLARPKSEDQEEG